MANTSLVGGVPDDVFISRAEQAAQLAEDAQTAAEAAQAAAEAALAATLAALAAQLIEDHADTTIAGKTTLDVLRWNGAAWVNAQVPIGDLSNVDVVGASVGDVLQFDGADWNDVAISALGFLPIAGGTLTGALVLDADPTLALHAATKQYVDASLSFYDVGAFFDGIPAASDDILRFVVNRNCFIPGSASDSRAESRVATTLAYTADLLRNGVSIGSIAWGAVATVATITITSAVNENFVPGDTLEVVGAVVPDASINDITVTIALTLGVG